MNDHAPHSQSQSYTLLRIKRKRTEEPLDALVFDSRVRRKKSRGGGIGVFQFAQTVEQDAWEDENRRKDLQDQISRLARDTSLKQPETQASAAPPSPNVHRHPKDDHARRYTIIEEAGPPVRLDSNKASSPTQPTVTSINDTPVSSDYRMYDAVLSPDKEEPESDPEMEKFLPMLNDYLNLHDITLPPPSAKTAADGRLPVPPIILTPSKDDYVWDVFYHRPISVLGEWSEVANVGTLTGLPPPITDLYDSASESEEEDHADEDSNAEEYYKNDYPDEEDSSSSDDDNSDQFHEDSDEDDDTRYNFDEGEDDVWA